MLIGRGSEQSALDVLVREAVAGQGRVLCVEGEAGIGKSALLAEFVDRAQAAGATVLTGRCDELGQTRPFAPLVEAGAAASLEEMARSLGDPSSRRPPLETGPEIRSLLIERIVTGLEDRCVHGPVALCIDDLHWADAATLLTLAAAVRRCSDLPFALGVAMRPHPRTRELSAFVADVCTAGAGDSRRIHLDLAALDEAGVAAIAGTVFGAPPAQPVLTVLGGCGGNPLLVVEAVTALRDSGAVVERDGQIGWRDSDAAGLPVTLRDTVRSRMAGLEGEIRAVAAIAALLGTRFTLADLAAVTERRAAQLLPLVEELIEARLLVDDGAALAFRHDLVRETVASSIPASVQAELHQAIADGLRRTGAPTARVAEHLALARPTDAGEAIQTLRAVAKDIVQQDPAAAAQLLRQARDLCPANDDRHDEILAELVDAMAWNGQTADAEEMAAEVLTRPVPALVEERCRSALGRSLVLLGRPQEAIGHEQRVIALREQLGMPTAWARAECAICRLFGVDLDGALADARVAVDLARVEGDLMAEILALCVEVFARNMFGETEAALELGTKAVQIADATPHKEGHRLHPHLFRGLALQTLGDHAGASAAFRQGRALGEALGASWALPIYHFSIALAHWDAGRWDDLLAEVDAGIAFGKEKNSTIAQVWAYAVAGRVHLYRGDLVAATAALDGGDRVLASGGIQYGADWLLLSRALLLEVEDRSDEAVALLRFGWDTAVGLQANAVATTFGPDLVRVSLGVDLEFAEQVASYLGDLAAGNPSDPVLSARSLRATGLVTGDHDLVAAAGERFAALGHVFEAAVVRTEAAMGMLARGGLTPEVSTLLDDALGVYDRLGAIREAVRIRAVLGSMEPARPRRSSPRAVEGWDSLTRTEMEVVDEVCAGRSNSEVADRLGVSRRTVEAHLRSIYTKLQVPTRLALSVAFRDRAAH